ncbi:MAG: chemotaxis protein CheW [bacterium]|nr:chemotaxis protein CheW [bacterium]
MKVKIGVSEREKSEIMEIELIFFRVQNQQFGVEIKSINRILSTKQVSTEQVSTKQVSVSKDNNIYLKGSQIPIIDLDSYFMLNSHKQKRKREIIIIELDGIKKGLLVDEILRILTLNVDKVKVVPSFIKKTARKDYFWAIAQVEQELIPLLDVRKLVGN